MPDQSAQLAAAIGGAARPLTKNPADYDPLLDLIGDARVVLIGEATHGTHEFYRERAEITKRLISERGFNAVAVEADWPDAYRVNRYVRGAGCGDATASEALGGFKRFPTWMWRNADVLDFIGWLRDRNAGGSAAPAGFYGLDLYSLRSSMQAVIDYLAGVDPEAAKLARLRYGCFDHFGEDPQMYGYLAGSGRLASCENAVVKQLTALRERAADFAGRDGMVAEDEYFYAEQNARIAQNAEEYYRAMFRGRVSSWNLRDRHMAETLDALLAHLDRRGGRTRAVVWAHNSHIGDARATEMGDSGELNIGQLARERYGDEAVLIGFSTYEGSVAAASDWDAPVEHKQVRPGLPGSYEDVCHQVGMQRFLLLLRGDERLRAALREPCLERAIGVIYRPETERQSHYFHARLADQFDALIHIDRTRAVEPLDRAVGWEPGELPDTYPSGDQPLARAQGS